MRIINLLLAAIFTLSLCLPMIPGDAYAKSEINAGPSEITIPTDININTADKELLTQLPGIGPKTADSIIEYRKTNGDFKSLDDLTGVKGIGEKTLSKLKPYLKKV